MKLAFAITDGKLDFGPFSMAAIAEKIRNSEVMPEDVLVDKDTGARAKIEDNPLSDVPAKRSRIDAAVPGPVSGDQQGIGLFDLSAEVT